MRPNALGLRLQISNAKSKTLEALEITLNQYTQFEKSTLEQVTALRQQILSLNVDHTDIAQLQQIEKKNE